MDDAKRGTNHSLFESVKGEIILEVLILSAGSPAQAELFLWRFSRWGKSSDTPGITKDRRESAELSWTDLEPNTRSEISQRETR